ncbi:hypothetical protein [uncultured Thermosynechococcus sp.]|nr:hypothetical protein [uncultured Thermosynechococcus sp.]
MGHHPALPTTVNNPLEFEGKNSSLLTPNDPLGLALKKESTGFGIDFAALSKTKLKPNN